MTPLEYLREELKSTHRALEETLRHEYAPDQSRAYFDECATRLAAISRAVEELPSDDPTAIFDILSELGSLASFISLVERSKLGEFSWAFGDAIQKMAEALFSEVDLGGDQLRPIVHMVSEGRGYRIINENWPAAHGSRRFIVVVFPRPLKHHVLLHAIFGHELGHTALYSPKFGGAKKSIATEFASHGALKSADDLTRWAFDGPPSVKLELQRIQLEGSPKWTATQKIRDAWITELTCDLFGLLLLGPAFVASHRAVVGPLSRTADGIGAPLATHPPFSVRRAVLIRAMRYLGWDKPVGHPESVIAIKQKNAIQYINEGVLGGWNDVLTEAQVASALNDAQALLRSYGVGYTQPSTATLTHLLSRLERGLPPTLDTISEDGTATIELVDPAHILYAGWVHWLSLDDLQKNADTFFDINKHCDKALFQQLAISLMKKRAA